MLKVRFIKLYQLSEDFFERHSKNEFSILESKKQQFIKRVFDMTFSALLLIVTFPVWLITAILIKLESKGPIFYTQERVGLNNQEFKVIKFRSMRIDAEKYGAKWAQKNDSRVTKVGNFIRKTRIDELPQLVNVIKGDMSVIGPRPERQVFINDLEREIDYYNFRHKVKPGITGLAQVCYPYGASIKDARWKHKYDMYYIKHYSFRLDCLIVIATIKTVFFGMGR